MSSASLRVRLCVPCFNESLRLPVFLDQLVQFAKDRSISDCQIDVEILDDGSADVAETRRVVLQTQNHLMNSWISVSLRTFEKNQGKGAVLRKGFQEALLGPYQVIGFFDGDGATPPSELSKLLQCLISDSNLDAVLGSRWKSLGRQVERSFKRHLSGRIFATILSQLFSIPIYDSQCGAKLFRRKILTRELLELCDDDRWLFDTQLVLVNYINGAHLLECPVNWKDQPGSKVRLIRDSWRMFWGLLKFKKKLSR